MRVLGLLIRSERIASVQLHDICCRLAGMIRARFSESLSGRIHVLPESRSLTWLEYSAAGITAGITTVAVLGKKSKIPKIFPMAAPTIVIECHLMPFEPEKVLKHGPSVAEPLTTELTGIMADCGMAVRETRLASLLIADQSIFILEELS
ncbi:MAG: hypothetical protein ACXACI_13195 [Candidatus Hodarchaeales archaeon]